MVWLKRSHIAILKMYGSVYCVLGLGSIEKKITLNIEKNKAKKHFKCGTSCFMPLLNGLLLIKNARNAPMQRDSIKQSVSPIH